MSYNEEILTLEITNSKTYSILQITNIDEVFDELLSKNSEDINIVDERIPYWTEIWPSAIGLSRYLIKNNHLFQDKSCIEIGAGLGLPSIVVSEYCKSILLTDYLEDALTFAKRNSNLNKINNISFKLLDWRSLNHDSEKFDIILASDIAYEKRFFEGLPEALMSLMHKDSIVILSEPSRKYAASFMKNLSKTFLTSHNTELVEWRGSEFKVGVYELRLK